MSYGTLICVLPDEVLRLGINKLVDVTIIKSSLCIEFMSDT